MEEKSNRFSLRGWRTVGCAFGAGIVLALVSAAHFKENGSALLSLLLRPWTLLGSALRAWSLRGAWGNAGAWAAVLALSLLPVVCLLLMRRKHRRPFRTSDLLFPAAGGGIFLCLYLLINPALLTSSLPVPRESASLNALREMIPALTLLSLLTACALAYWADRLDKGKPLNRLLWSMELLLKCIMALTAASIGYVLTQSIQSIPLSTQPVYIPSPFFYNPSEAYNPPNAYAQLLLTLFSLAPDLFLILTLRQASRLCTAFGKSGFQSETETCARALALWAKRALIASVLCMAGRNLAAMLLSGVLADLSVALTLPLSEMAFSCGAMLLAHCIAAACRIQRENDLMI